MNIFTERHLRDMADQFLQRDSINPGPRIVEKLAAMAGRPKACSYAAKYKAIRRPRCNNGSPCQACLMKWAGRKK